MFRSKIAILALVFVCSFWTKLGATTPEAQEVFAKGVQFLEKQEWTVAEKVFRDAIKLQKDYAEAYNKLGLALYNQRRMLDAVEQFKHAVALDPRFTEALYHLGLGLESLDIDPKISSDEKTKKKILKTKSDLAIASYRKVLEVNPVNDVPSVANTHWRLGLLVKAKSIEAAKESAPPNLKEAIEHEEAAIKLVPDFPEAHNELGRLYDLIGRFPEAIEQYSQAILGHKFFAEAYSNRGIAQWHNGNWDNALADARLAIEIDPKFAGGHYNFAEIVFARVEEIRRGGDRSILHLEIQKAIDEYRVATELDPSFMLAWHGLARAYRGYHDFEKSEEIYTKILSMDKRDKKAKAALKDLKNEQKKYYDHIPKQLQGGKKH